MRHDCSSHHAQADTPLLSASRAAVRGARGFDGDRHHHCGAGSLGAHPYELRLHRLRAGDGTGHERHPVPQDLYRDTDTLGWEKRFADTLEQASGNITEEAERKVITDLQVSWDAYRQTPDDANYRGLHARIDALVQVNERGMFLRLSKNARFRDIMMAVTAAAFLLGTFWAFLHADSVAERLESGGMHP